MRRWTTAEVVGNVTMGGGWVTLPERGIAFCAPTKNGCSAIYGTIAGKPVRGGRIDALKHFSELGQGPYLPGEVPDDYELWFAVRGPIDRFASLWRCFSRGKEKGVGTREIGGMSPQELIKHVVANPYSNRHWIPQSSHYIEGARIIPYREFLLRLGYDNPQVNVTQRVVSDPIMPTADILEHYDTDMWLWNHREQ